MHQDKSKAKFKVGDTVCIKSSSEIKMTINEILLITRQKPFYIGYECVWTHNSTTNRGEFSEDSLKLCN